MFAYKKGYSRKWRLLNTVIAAIYIVSQSLGINVFVTDIPQRSYTGSCVADNLSKANTIFMTSSNRPLLIPNTIQRICTDSNYGMPVGFYPDALSNTVTTLHTPRKNPIVVMRHLQNYNMHGGRGNKPTGRK